MGIFKPGVNIGKAIAGRVKGFPVGEKKPKKKRRGDSHSCWILCPSFHMKPPKKISREAAEKDHNYSIFIFSESSKERDEALNHMIRCGQEEIEAGNKRFWLHAVNYKLQHKALFQAELKYIFRVRQIPEEIS